MEKRYIGKTKMLINRVGFGGIPVQRISKEEASVVIKYAINKGVNFIDTARGYTCSEEYIGYAVENVERNKYYIATKSMARTYDGMKEDILKSLDNLKCGYIDLYQIHNLTSEKDLETVLNGAYKALIDAKEKGLIKHIGITSHNYEFLYDVLDKNLFETIQFPYNIVERKSESLFEKAHNMGIGTICMKPLAGGAIDKGSVAIKYLLNDENVDVIIPGMALVSEVDENISVTACEYTKEEKEYIERIINELDGDFCRRCGYCAPCTVGINIASCFLFEGYYRRYNLKGWAKNRYNSMDKFASDCIECGACVKRCPYGLDIPKKLKSVKEVFGK